VGCGAAEPTAVAGGKDYLRSAASLVGQPQQSPTANSVTLTSPPVVGRQGAAVNVVNEKSLADYNFAPFRKEPKAKKSIAMTLMRDVQGSAAQKLEMFQKVMAAGGFAKEHPADLEEAEKTLRAFAAAEKENR